ncbi:MAG: hypothetical protein ACRDLT_08415 [Solirubrobacteraceae bacterium]
MSERMWNAGAFTVVALIAVQVGALMVAESRSTWPLTCTIGLCVLAGVISHAPLAATWLAGVGSLDDTPGASTDPSLLLSK